MRKFGIAVKLYLAFGSIFLFAVVVSSVGWKGFQYIADSQNSVIDQAIPSLRQAHQLSALNASIATAAQQLLRANNEQERKHMSSQLFSQVNRLHTLLDDFQKKQFSVGSLQSLRQTVRNLESKLRQQDEWVRQRNQRQAYFNQLVTRLIAATEALNELADSLVANTAATTTAITSNLYDLVEDNASKKQLYSVFDRLVEVDLDAMERMYELRLRSANLNSFFNQVAKESDLEMLNLLHQKTTQTLSILTRRISEIDDPRRRQKAGELLNLMKADNSSPYGDDIFETRASLIKISNTLTGLSVEIGGASQVLNGIVNELSAAGGSLINQVSTTAKESLDISRSWFTVISILLLLVAAAILWWFIKRNVVRRLLSLESATHSITDGDYSVDIIVEGDDELTDMGKALQGFRNNAIENRKLDKELLQHKMHLEDLVEERSEQLRETNNMLFEEVQNHAIARQKAEQANQAKTAFLATMSHELRTPLSGALGTLRLLSDTQLQSRQLEYVQIIDAANTMLLDIVNDILGYSQLDAGRLKLEKRPFELGELLNNVMRLITVSVSEKNNRLELKIDRSQPCWLMGDSGKLHQILINLIGNANKFTRDGLIILQVDSDIDQQQNNIRLGFSVKDSGIGIAKDKQSEVFQAFTQVDTRSARRYGGIGLGLAICDRLVAAMGGEISLDSELGKGTTIRFEVRVDMCDSVSALPQSSAPEHPIVESLPVLMVEDDATNSMVTRYYLEHLGHQVSAAQTGEEALRLLKASTPSIILLDISLPGIDGLTILKHIRAHTDPNISEIPVIAMSAHVFNEEVEHYLKAGMNGFLGKPFSLEDVEHMIARIIGGNDDRKQCSFDKASNGVVFNSRVISKDISSLGLNQVEKMVALFYQDSIDLKMWLVKSIVEYDPDLIEKYAHKLNGAASNFGFEKLCGRLKQIENLAINKSVVPMEVIELLEAEYAEATELLRRYMAEQTIAI